MKSSKYVKGLNEKTLAELNEESFFFHLYFLLILLRK